MTCLNACIQMPRRPHFTSLRLRHGTSTMRARRSFVYGLACLVIGLAGATSLHSRTMLVIGNPESAESWAADAPALTVDSRTWIEAAGRLEADLYPEYNEASGGIVSLDFSETHVMPIRIAPDFNLSLGYLERGGWQRERIFERTPGHFDRALDGDTTTVYNYRGDIGGPEGTPRPTVDLGAIFPINRILFFTHPDSTEEYVDVFRLYVDGELVRDELDNKKDSVEVTFPLLRGREVYMEVVERFRAGVLIPNKTWQLAEFEIYGDGYVPEATYISKIFDIEDVGPANSGELASWGRLYWTGTRDPNARTIIRTRTGRAEDTPEGAACDRQGSVFGGCPDPSVYSVFTERGDELSTFSDDGEPLTLDDYGRTQGRERKKTDYSAQLGPITYDHENWSFWSTPYDFDKGAEGVPVASPGPRRYIQFRIDFTPTISDGSRLEAIGFDFSKPPSAGRAVAEIFPKEVPAAVDTTFTYTLLPELGDTDGGFDSLEIETFVQPSAVRLVRIDSAGTDKIICAPCLLHPDDTHPNAEIQDDRLVVHFDTLKGVADNGKRVQVVFDASVVKFGTEFKGRIFIDGGDEVRQLVDGGDAIDRYSGGGVVVTIPLSEELVSQAQVQPNPFTPNGDDINDETVLSYALLNLTDVAAAELAIYDLTGRRVRQLQSEPLVSGTYGENWNGRDDDGRLVPPGIYIYRISVETDERNENHSGIVSVVY